MSPTTTSERIRSRIEQLTTAVETTSAKLLAAEQAHRTAFAALARLKASRHWRY